MSVEGDYEMSVELTDLTDGGTCISVLVNLEDSGVRVSLRINVGDGQNSASGTFAAAYGGPERLTWAEAYVDQRRWLRACSNVLRKEEERSNVLRKEEEEA